MPSWSGGVSPWAWLCGDPPQAWSCLYPQSCLEFSLRIQEFIELIRQNKRLDAVRYVERGQTASLTSWGRPSEGL